MDRTLIAQIYSNTIALGYVPQSKMDDFKAARERGDPANSRPFHVDIRGTGFMIGPGLAVTAAHLVDWYSKMRIADENSMLCSVEERGSQGVRHWFIPWTRQSWLGPLFLRGRVAAITPIGLSWHEHADGFLVDVTGARGLSGGPVCNSEGKVIGVFTGGVEKEESVIDSKTKKTIDDHAVPIPYNIGRVMPIDWRFIQPTIDTLLAQGLAVDDRQKPAEGL